MFSLRCLRTEVHTTWVTGCVWMECITHLCCVSAATLPCFLRAAVAALSITVCMLLIHYAEIITLRCAAADTLSLVDDSRCIRIEWLFACRLALAGSDHQVSTIVHRTAEDTAGVQARRPGRARLCCRSLSIRSVSQHDVFFCRVHHPSFARPIFSSRPSCRHSRPLFSCQILRDLMCSWPASSTQCILSPLLVSVVDINVAFCFFKTCCA